MTDRRITLSPTVTREDVALLAAIRRWRPVAVAEARADGPYERVWEVGPETGAHYVEDDLLGVAYVRLIGDDAEAESAAATFAAELDTIATEEAVEWTYRAATSEQRVLAASYLAASAPSAADPRVAAALERLLADDDPEVRRAGIFACSYPSWPELDPLLEQVRRHDPEPEIREAARRALAAIRRHRNGDGS